MGREVEISLLPQRIVSLVPSQTELLFDLGLSDRIVGCTKFCIYPKEAVSAIEKVGGTKNFSIEKITSLNPDLIIGNKEENIRDLIEQLDENFPVWMSDILGLDDALEMISQIGKITNSASKSEIIRDQITKGFKSLTKSNFAKRVAYLIWRRPYMAAASGTFINEILGYCNWKNVFQELDRYPEFELDTLKELQPELILLSSEPYPFKQKHLVELKSHFPNSTIRLVDGELFSWYGSRLVQTPDYLKSLIQDF